jgi:hypothetical protein
MHMNILDRRHGHVTTGKKLHFISFVLTVHSQTTILLWATEAMMKASSNMKRKIPCLSYSNCCRETELARYEIVGVPSLFTMLVDYLDGNYP